MDMMKKGLAWLKARVSERTSWDGAVITQVKRKRRKRMVAKRKRKE